MYIERINIIEAIIIRLRLFLQTEMGRYTILALIALLLLFGIIAIITWIIKTIWYAGRGKKYRKSDDWLIDAQERQNRRYEYSDPVVPKKYPTGWTYNEKKQKWEPPRKGKQKIKK